MLAICLMAEIAFFTLMIRFFSDKSLDAGKIMKSPLIIIAALGVVSIPILIQIYPQVLYGIPRWRSRMKHEETDGNTSIGPFPALQEDPEKATRAQVAMNTSNSVDKDAWHNVHASGFEALSDRVLEVMNDQRPWLAHDFSLDDLAKIMDVPRHHLYYCFNNILKTRFTRLRAEYRVRHAQYLIENGGTRDKTMEAIGIESGFSSRGNFMATFREVTGMTPGDYLRLKEKGGSSVDV
jgi:AraC-like DNA-binding protein